MECMDHFLSSVIFFWALGRDLGVRILFLYYPSASSITTPGEPFSSYKLVCESGIWWSYRGGEDLIRCFDDIGGAALRIGNGSPRRYH